MKNKELIREIFGRGYTLQYRWFRIKELFSFLPTYYEITVIPAIVLSCLACILGDSWSFVNTSMFTYTVGDAIGIFIFFLSIMTIEDIYKALTTNPTPPTE